MEVREKYEEKVDAQLHAWRDWIENFKSDLMVSDIQEITSRQQLMGQLEDCQNIAQERLEVLRSSHDEHWELAKQAVERAMIDLKRLLDESGRAHAGQSLSLQTSRAHVYTPFSKRG